MKEKVDPGTIISTLLEDIRAWKSEDILPDEFKSRLEEAQDLLMEAKKFHERYLPGRANYEAKQKTRAPQGILNRINRENQDNCYKRDNFISQADKIIEEVLAEIERMAE